MDCLVGQLLFPCLPSERLLCSWERVMRKYTSMRNVKIVGILPCSKVQYEMGMVYNSLCSAGCGCWCWIAVRKKYCWLADGWCWFGAREKYCLLVGWQAADKPAEQREWEELLVCALLECGCILLDVLCGIDLSCKIAPKERACIFRSHY